MKAVAKLPHGLDLTTDRLVQVSEVGNGLLYGAVCPICIGARKRHATHGRIEEWMNSNSGWKSWK